MSPLCWESLGLCDPSFLLPRTWAGCAFFFSLSATPSTKPTHRLSAVHRQRWGRGVHPSPVLLSWLLAPAHHPQPPDALTLAHHPQTLLPGLMGASSTSSPQSPSFQPHLQDRERQAGWQGQCSALGQPTARSVGLRHFPCTKSVALIHLDGSSGAPKKPFLAPSKSPQGKPTAQRVTTLALLAAQGAHAGCVWVQAPVAKGCLCWCSRAQLGHGSPQASGCWWFQHHAGEFLRVLCGATCPHSPRCGWGWEGKALVLEPRLSPDHLS